MTDQEIEILTSTNMLGKVIQDAIFFLATQGQGNESRTIAGEMIYTPGEGCVALSLVDVTKGGRKRKEGSRVGNNYLSKRGSLKKFCQTSIQGIEKGVSLSKR